MATLPESCFGFYLRIVLLQVKKKIIIKKIKPQNLDLFQSAELLQSQLASQKSGYVSVVLVKLPQYLTS